MVGNHEIGSSGDSWSKPCFRLLDYHHHSDKNHRRAEQSRGEIDRMLVEGAPAPDFTAFDHTGNEIRLSDLRGKKVWLWFFSSPGGGN